MNTEALVHRSATLSVARAEPLAGLRFLDVDDLYLMSLLSDGFRLVDAARHLSLTQPAITQRIHKIEQALKVSLLDRSIRGTRLSGVGIQICAYAHGAVRALEQIGSRSAS